METEKLRQAKERLRQEIQKAAAGLTEAYRREASRRIAGQVLRMESYRQARTVMGFMSLPNEPDTREILEDALNSGKTVLLPRCMDKEHMAAFRVTDLDSLRPGTWGIREPEPVNGEDVPEPDLILVPCVTVSPEGIRLGHGAGYYDRFLQGSKAETVCLCYRRLMRDTVPGVETDIRVCRVVTEAETGAY